MSNKEKQLIEILCDYFEIAPEDTPEETLKSYGFTSGAYLGYGGAWLSLEEVVRALRENGFLND